METRKIFCYECKNLELSDCYGECSAGHRGIVNPYDTCKYAEKSKVYVASKPPILNAALIRFQDGKFIVHKYCRYEDAMEVMEIEKKNPEYSGASWTVVDFTEEMNAAAANKATEQLEECSSDCCIFNPKGVCLYPLLFGKKAKVTEDGCSSGIVNAEAGKGAEE